MELNFTPPISAMFTTVTTFLQETQNSALNKTGDLEQSYQHTLLFIFNMTVKTVLHENITFEKVLLTTFLPVGIQMFQGLEMDSLCHS